MSDTPTLVSHYLCPYVQRAVIALSEKDAPFERVYIDLADKPEWFLKLSPLGRVPILKVGEAAIFESAVIVEYLEETQPRPLHPSDPFERAQHRSWMEFGSSVLNDIAGFYNAKDEEALSGKVTALANKFQQLDDQLEEGPFFAGRQFSLVDAVFGPVFRYFDVFDQIRDFGVFDDKPKVVGWRNALAQRPSIKGAVTEDYNERLMRFLVKRESCLSGLIRSEQAV